MRFFILKILPYLVSVIFGLIILFITYIIEDHKVLSDLLLNISAGLLSIPLVFISYEVVSKICTRDLDETLLKSISFEANSTIMDVLNNIKYLMSYNRNLDDSNNLIDFLSMPQKEVSRKIDLEHKLDSDFIDKLSKDKDALSSLIHKSGTIKVLSSDQLKILIYIVRDCNIIYNNMNIILNNKKVTEVSKTAVATHIKDLLGNSNLWFDNFETNILLH